MNNSKGTKCQKILIVLFVTGKHPQGYYVPPKAKVSVLDSLFHDDQERRYLFDGIVLKNDMSFNEQGVLNGSSLIAILSSELENPQKAWLKISKDCNMVVKPNTNKNPKDSQQSNKNILPFIRDLRMNRIESHRKVYYKMVRQFLANEEQKPTSFKEPQLDIKLDAPSSNELPVFW